jgi:hypothetical protein
VKLPQDQPKTRAGVVDVSRRGGDEKGGTGRFAARERARHLSVEASEV